MSEAVENLTLTALVWEADEIAAILEKTTTLRKAAVVHEMAKRLAGGHRRQVAPLPITPRRPVRVEVPLKPVSDGKRWCNQCDMRVDEKKASACRSTFCSLKLRA